MGSLVLLALLVFFYVGGAQQCMQERIFASSAAHGRSMLQKIRLKDVGTRTWGNIHDEVHPSACPDGSEVFTLSAESNAMHKANFSKVMMADYPSTGSTWLRKMLTAITLKENAGNPSCSIYPEGDCKPDLASDLRCDCEGFDRSPDAVLIKSHYPAQELYQRGSIDTWQYNATMDYDKILQLVRHPQATVSSNIRRWGGSTSSQRNNLHCWGMWWERVKQTAGQSRVLVVRYEDLCLNSSKIMHEVMQFLGGSFAAISLASVQETLRERPDLACIHRLDNSSGLSADKNDDQPLEKETSDLMSSWGYSINGSSDSPYTDFLLQRTSELPHTRPHTRNPWSQVW